MELKSPVVVPLGGGMQSVFLYQKKERGLVLYGDIMNQKNGRPLPKAN